jgi:hypothetical protein
MSDNRHPPFVSPKGFHDDMDHNGGSSSSSSDEDEPDADEPDAEVAAEMAEAARAEAHNRLRRLHVAVAATQQFIYDTAQCLTGRLSSSAECNDHLNAASSRLRELEGTPEPAATQAGAAGGVLPGICAAMPSPVPDAADAAETDVKRPLENDAPAKRPRGRPPKSKNKAKPPQHRGGPSGSAASSDPMGSAEHNPSSAPIGSADHARHYAAFHNRGNLF